MKWRSKITCVDIATGEEVPRKKITNGTYIVINKTIKHIKNGNTNGTKNIRWECKRNNQLEFKF